MYKIENSVPNCSTFSIMMITNKQDTQTIAS